jgi:hypothetical protein
VECAVGFNYVEDAGNEPKTDAMFALAVRRSYNSADLTSMQMDNNYLYFGLSVFQKKQTDKDHKIE